MYTAFSSSTVTCSSGCLGFCNSTRQTIHCFLYICELFFLCNKNKLILWEQSQTRKMYVYLISCKDYFQCLCFPKIKITTRYIMLVILALLHYFCILLGKKPQSVKLYLFFIVKYTLRYHWSEAKNL